MGISMPKRRRDDFLMVKINFARVDSDETIAEWVTTEENMRRLFFEDSWIVQLMNDKVPSADKFKKLFERQTVGASLKKLTQSSVEENEESLVTTIPVTVEERYADQVVQHVVNHLNGYGGGEMEEQQLSIEKPLSESEIIDSILFCEYLGMSYDKL